MRKLHNEGIKSELDAWLTFLGSDEPEYIVKLIQEYPQFKSMYEDLYNMCLNIEGVMNMFSKELQILDRNTVKYMIDELQDQLDEKVSELTTTKSELDTTKSELDTTKSELGTTKSELDTTKSELDTTKSELGTTKSELDTTKSELDTANDTIAKLQAELEKYKNS